MRYVCMQYVMTDIEFTTKTFTFDIKAWVMEYESLYGVFSTWIY